MLPVQDQSGKILIIHRFLRRTYGYGFPIEAAPFTGIIVSFSVRSYKIFLFADYAPVRSPAFPVHYKYIPTAKMIHGRIHGTFRY